jgi:hypothetical protein
MEIKSRDLESKEIRKTRGELTDIVGKMVKGGSI